MPKGLSLHIGVNRVDGNHYGGWEGPLNACEYDALDMQALAEKEGFHSQKLLTADATRDAVKSAISQAAAELEGGDIFLLTYSGHGGQVTDYNGDEATLGNLTDTDDETWCLFDCQLIDDELQLLWSEFAEHVRILVFSDSCHSGTVTRSVEVGAFFKEQAGRVLPDGEEVRFRRMPITECGKVYRANKKIYDDIQKGISKHAPPVRATIRLISGCQDNQLSLDGSSNGFFTGRLLQVWSSGEFNGNYKDFHRAIVRMMPPTQSPNHFVYGAQNPSFDAQTPFSIA